MSSISRPRNSVDKGFWIDNHLFSPASHERSFIGPERIPLTQPDFTPGIAKYFPAVVSPAVDDVRADSDTVAFLYRTALEVLIVG